jgi:thiamine-phosphate pyrophosphorylase
MIELPRIYPILDGETLARRGVAVETAAAAWLEGGARILQIRHKGHWGRAVYDAAARVASLCRECGARFVVNDRADIAMLLGAGLHVGQDDLAPSDARRLMGAGAVIGFSSHNPEQLCAAAREPVDYVALGPVFATATKANPDPVVGVEEVRRCRALIEKPLVAIGGITMDNARDVLAAGADSLAVIAGLLPETGDADALRRCMEEWQRLAES